MEKCISTEMKVYLGELAGGGGGLGVPVTAAGLDHKVMLMPRLITLQSVRLAIVLNDKGSVIYRFCPRLASFRR